MMNLPPALVAMADQELTDLRRKLGTMLDAYVTALDKTGDDPVKALVITLAPTVTGTLINPVGTGAMLAVALMELAKLKRAGRLDEPPLGM